MARSNVETSGHARTRHGQPVAYIVCAGLAIAFYSNVPAVAGELTLSCLLMKDVNGNDLKNPPNLTMTVDVDARSVLLMGAEPQRDVAISKSTITFTRANSLFSIDRGTGRIQIIDNGDPSKIVTGVCQPTENKF
ncbi:hypothetical protein LB559_06430 [Mesorhizobium sp. BR1-1-3]|uniref:hypothetical protein n=1 Tax=unclassified Mesorhizobium TaxID=325217 RepID=UPI000F74EFE7|nr:MULTISPECIES: hypothetical protein [unclassified Mesorhizobium]AZO45288.1 hypothetical protein EJ076_31410 [Mesorhizobium sp. M7D.F.Ca.US.005.01.1.1]MBZ9887575.1 hypothetical protein [Mesorhizobium sp. BR1-1-3]